LRNQKTEESASFPRRRFHVEPGPREKAVRRIYFIIVRFVIVFHD